MEKHYPLEQSLSPIRTVHGFQNWYFVFWIGLVTLVFSWLGARATKTMKAWVLRVIFGILIGITGIIVATGLI